MIFFGIGLHEYAHCKVADAAGDPTPGSYGRVTLNLFKHFELMGSLMILFTMASGFGIGWGKPAPMDPRKMKNPRWDFFLAIAAGPISNILQAFIWAILFRLFIAYQPSALVNSEFLYNLLTLGVSLNLSLCFFNLFPLGLLDGHWLLGLLMPEKPRYYWFQFNRQYGLYILLGIIFIGQYMQRSGGISPIGMWVRPPTQFLFEFLTGVPY